VPKTASIDAARAQLHFDSPVVDLWSWVAADRVLARGTSRGRERSPSQKLADVMEPRVTEWRVAAVTLGFEVGGKIGARLRKT
jgi:hypothetical protein